MVDILSRYCQYVTESHDLRLILLYENQDRSIDTASSCMNFAGVGLGCPNPRKANPVGVPQLVTRSCVTKHASVIDTGFGGGDS